VALSNLLCTAHGRRGDLDGRRSYAYQSLLLAEGLNDPEAISMALNQVAVGYLLVGAATAGRANFEMAANLAREHNLLNPLATALINLASLLNSRDLPAALDYAREAHEVASRTGNQGDIDYAIGNYLIASWLGGDLAGIGSALPEALDAAMTNDVMRPTLRTIEGWLADATGQPVPEPDVDLDTDDESTLIWEDSSGVTRALTAGDATRAAEIASESITRLIATAGIDEDFSVLWPPLVAAALAARDLGLAGRLLDPVENAPPGRRSPAVAAQWHRLRGLVSAARGDDSEFAETEMRTGITALGAFGAVGYRAQAQEELARWLVDQNRPDDARPLIDAARTTYTDIGATGWLAKLDAWNSSTRKTAPVR
jgi:hypothetical protein